jgi:hypothetical protein
MVLATCCRKLDVYFLREAFQSRDCGDVRRRS